MCRISELNIPAESPIKRPLYIIDQVAGLIARSFEKQLNTRPRGTTEKMLIARHLRRYAELAGFFDRVTDTMIAARKTVASEQAVRQLKQASMNRQRELRGEFLRQLGMGGWPSAGSASDTPYFESLLADAKDIRNGLAMTILHLQVYERKRKHLLEAARVLDVGGMKEFVSEYDPVARQQTALIAALIAECPHSDMSRVEDAIRETTSAMTMLFSMPSDPAQRPSSVPAVIATPDVPGFGSVRTAHA